MIENPTSGLTLLDPDREVVVTREEFHQPALRAYAPRTDGRGRRVAVELVFAPITAGQYRGQRGIEVRLDGQRVGELTALMARRYGPLVEDVLRRGGRPACIALVVNGRRGVEVELRLPVVAAGAGPLPAGPVPAPRARRRRAPYLIGAGVTTLLIVVGASIGQGGGETAVTATGNTAAVATTTPVAAAPTTTAPTTRPAPTSPPAAVVPPAVPAAAVARRTAAAAVPRPAPRPTSAAPKPAAPRPAAPKPAAPKPSVAAAPKPSSSCDPHYSGCVPVASDVDCAGGSGNGPAYVSGPVRVIGKDIYGLDADKNGIGCE